MSRGRDAALRAAYRVGWRLAARLPARLVGAGTTVASAVAVRYPGRHLGTLRTNLAVATGAPVPDRLLRAAVASYLRTFLEVLALPGRTAALVASVRTVDEAVLRTAHDGPGAVVALPHSGNWDLAGAWAAAQGMAVSTVAERLGAAEYADFVRFRRGLGMRVYAHDDPAVLGHLVRDVRQRRLVCLVADRDLTGSGLPVRWRGHPVRMPGGPALVARRSGAALVPAACSYAGPDMVIAFGPPVPHRPGRAGLVAMTQQVADYFADQVAAAPQDWHLMQPFFDDAGAPAGPPP